MRAAHPVLPFPVPLGALLARRLAITALTGAGLFLASSVGGLAPVGPTTGFAQAAPDGPPATMSGGGLPPLPDAEPPAAVRDVGVAELPLLVTEPPADETEAEIPAPVTGGAKGALNPFSPLLLPPPETAPAPPAPAPPVVTEQLPAAPSAPAAQTIPTPAPPVSTVVPAPAPQARLSTPSIPKALGVRRPVAARTLGTRILGRTLGTSSVAAPNPLAGTAAIRVPASLTPPATASTTGSRLTPLGLANDGNFTLVSSNRVSESLSELRVNFTAMATGTGVFRVGNSEIPVLLRVGEPLPGTRLVLSRLTRANAQFSEDDARHTLSLNP